MWDLGAWSCRYEGQGRSTTSFVLVASPFNAEIVSAIVGRYAAESDAEVVGDGGGGRIKREERTLAIIVLLW